MKKLNIKIFSIFFSVLILLSSTGILLVHHTCTKCDSNDWHLFSIVNCQNNIFEPTCCTEDNHNESECNDKEFINNDSPCCTNNGLFYKIGLFFSDIDNHINVDFTDDFLVIISNLHIVNFHTPSISDNLIGKSPPLNIVKPFILFEVFRI